MLKVIIAIVLCCLFSPVFSQPIINFDKTEVDLGMMEENDPPKTVTFNLKNVGTQPLIISDISTSCGCILSEYSQKPIRKDSSISLKITVNPKNRPGYFNKTITVTSNTTPDVNLLIVKGVVRATPRHPQVEYPVKRGSLRFVGNGFNIGTVTTEKPAERSLEIYNDSDKEIKILHKAMLPSHIQLITKDLILKPRQVSWLKIQYDAKAKNDYGFVSDYIELYTDSPKDSLIPMSVFGSIEDFFPSLSAKERANAPNINIEKKEIYLGRYGKGSDVIGSFEVKNTGPKPLIVKKIRPSCSCVTATMSDDKVDRGESVLLSFKIKTKELIGPNVKTITLFTNDPTENVVVLSVKFDIF